MTADRDMIRSLGTEPPILADGFRAPDRREISLRWLSGTFLTGITSCILMGVALFAALDGRQQLAIPAEAYAVAPPEGAAASAQDTVRGARLFGPKIAARPVDKAILDVPTVIKDGEREVVRKQPFAHVKMALAADYAVQDRYPPFDPLSIFAIDQTTPPVANRTGSLYGSNIESEVILKSSPFPSVPDLPLAGEMTFDEVEENVRSNGSVLTDGDSQVAALYYIDPRRFDTEDTGIDLAAGLSARVVEENMSVAEPEAVTAMTPEFADDVLPVRSAQSVSALMISSGYPSAKAEDVEKALAPHMPGKLLAVGDVLRVGLIQRGDEVRLVRFSLYHNSDHVVTLAVNDGGRLVEGSEPPQLAAISGAFDGSTPAIVTGRDLPRAYDGIYRAALSYGMSKELTALVVRLLASNVDFQAQLKPTDMLEAVFSVTDEEGKATEDSELLYVRARFGDTITQFYRFQDPEDGSIDYFDEDGKSIRQFLLRNPVPNGRFTSGFGMRRHPILGYSRMHTGVDWAAPRGTPIIAAGNGVVEKAGWASGYGNQTLIRHANGYVTSYNHQSGIAKGIVPGAKVTQGQVIGFVGSTGSSTGAHLHYELIVNGTKVDAMKVRLPGGKALDGPALASFEEERQRIDTLLESGGRPAQVASR
ncbi:MULTISPECIES: M23 family metallopeptidase [Rhizobium]|uniref:Peptidase M24 n=1 Tax=Rhizobium wuzhouense TaxID=1986026 RepID=A0ABX5NS84_9HYPH|nr:MULTISPECIES: M23 family metallopeptidase [Rhizobium]PYB73892.1 peptidase M24 [Rhizobium wuzhouense]RKE80295.1 murein DD-endopeptidase MepM/ murein hydrolase activator NlpD [Rhizobium sp. AG855]